MSLNVGDKIPEFELFNHDKLSTVIKIFWGKNNVCFYAIPV